MVKCVVLRFSRRFRGCNVVGNKFEYKIGDRFLEIVEYHRDLEVIVDRSLKFHVHVRDLVRKAAGLASNLLQSTVNRSPEFMIALFVSNIRPILDHCSCIWNVGYVSDLALLKTVQRRWSKKVVGFSNLSYAERLRSLNLFSIKGRLLRSDLIKYWKIVCCESEGFDLSVLFQRSQEERTRGHKFRLVMPRCNTDIK